MTFSEKYTNSGALLIEGTVLSKCLISAGEVTIPEGVTEIADGAFFALKNITRVILPQSLKRIGERAFAYCISLEEITVPDGVTEICDYAFSHCLRLRSITLPHALVRLFDGMLESCHALKEITLPSSLEEIGAYALFDCRALETVEIPASVARIGSAALGDCAALASVKIPEGIEVLTDHVLAGCRALKSVTLPASLREIGDAAFSGCERLEEAELPSGVVSVGENAFAYCVGLTLVSFPQSVVSLGADCLVGLEPPVVIHMENPKLFRALSAGTKLLAVEGFLSRYERRVTSEEECEIYGEFIKAQKKTLARLLGYSMGLYSFLTDQRLLKLSEADEMIRSEDVGIELKTLLLEYKDREMTPQMLRKMEREEERRIERLLLGGARTVADWKRELRFSKMADGSLVIEKYIGSDAVAVIPARIGRSRVGLLGAFAFADCTQVSVVTVEEGVRQIGIGAFMGCTSLQTVCLPTSITFIGDSVFDGCERPTVIVPSGSYAASRLKEEQYCVEIQEE